MVAEILNVGTEILIGDILNTNSRYLSLKLSEIGFDVLWHTTVGDNEKRIQLAVETALKRSDVLVITGGLGPTKDDITKEAVAAALKKDLVEDLEVRKNIEKIFKNKKVVPTENNFKQSLVIKGATVFKNEQGTAPAIAVEEDGKVVVLLPGPPEELAAIFEKDLEKYLKKFTNFTIFSKNVHIYGLPESVVDEKVSDLLVKKNPTVGIYAKEGEVRLRVTAKAEDRKICEDMVDLVVDSIKNRVGKYIYGIDVLNMQNALVKTFIEKNKTLAVAESCTGGLISSKIVEISGSSKIFKLGAVCYSNEAKQKILNVKKSSLDRFGAVSSVVAKEMAFGARNACCADFGVATTGIAGPQGGSVKKPVGLVYVGISSRKETKAYKLLLSNGEKDERNKIRIRAALFAMDRIRREALKEE